jgi:hypothetical protein
VGQGREAMPREKSHNADIGGSNSIPASPTGEADAPGGNTDKPQTGIPSETSAPGGHKPVRARAEVAQAQVRVSLGLQAEPENGSDLGLVPPDLDQTFSSVRQARNRKSPRGRTTQSAGLRCAEASLDLHTPRECSRSRRGAEPDSQM